MDKHFLVLNIQKCCNAGLYTHHSVQSNVTYCKQAINTNFSVPNKHEIQYELLMNIYEMF